MNFGNAILFISDYIDAKDWPAVICCSFVSSTVSEWLRGGAGGQTRQDDLCMQRLLFICKGIYRDRFWEVIFRWSGRSVFRPELTGLYISIPLFLYLSLHRSIFYFPLVSNSIFPSKTHPSAYALWLSRMYRTLSNYTHEHTHTHSTTLSISILFTLCLFALLPSCVHACFFLSTVSCPCFHLCCLPPPPPALPIHI